MPAQAAVNTAFAGFLRAAAIRPGTQPGSFGMIGLMRTEPGAAAAGRRPATRGRPARRLSAQVRVLAVDTGQALFASTLAERLRGHELKGSRPAIRTTPR